MTFAAPVDQISQRDVRVSSLHMFISIGKNFGNIFFIKANTLQTRGPKSGQDLKTSVHRVDGHPLFCEGYMCMHLTESEIIYDTKLLLFQSADLISI